MQHWMQGYPARAALHDLFVVHEAMTPGDYKRRGEGLPMRWGWAESPFGSDAAVHDGPRLGRSGICGTGRQG